MRNLTSVSRSSSVWPSVAARPTVSCRRTVEDVSRAVPLVCSVNSFSPIHSWVTGMEIGLNAVGFDLRSIRVGNCDVGCPYSDAAPHRRLKRKGSVPTMSGAFCGSSKVAKAASISLVKRH
jgi:hypothetical protein